MKFVFRFPAKSILIIGIVVILTGSLRALAQDLTKDEIYLATKQGKNYIRSKDHKFGCDDTIYLFIESANHQFSGKTLKTIWQNTGTNVKHLTTKGFSVRKSNQRLWSWSGIVFTTGSDAPLEKMLGFLDPAAGREAFIGQWTINASVEGLVNKTLEMEVLC